MRFSIGPHAESGDVAEADHNVALAQEPRREPSASGDDRALTSAPAHDRTPLLPTIAGRIDDVSTALATLALRLDTFGAAIATVNALGSDRFTDLAETMRERVASPERRDRGVSTLSGSAALTDIRRSTATNDDAMRKLAGRVEESLSDSQALAEQLRAAAYETALARHRPPTTSTSNSPMRTTSNSPMSSSYYATNSATEASAAPSDDHLELTHELQLLRDEITQVKPAPPSDDHLELSHELQLLRDEITQLKRRLGVRGRAPVSLDAEQIQSIADALQGPSQAMHLNDDALDRIADAVVRRLDSMLEVVPSESAGAPSNPAKLPHPTPSSAGSKRAATGSRAKRGSS